MNSRLNPWRLEIIALAGALLCCLFLYAAGRMIVLGYGLLEWGAVLLVLAAPLAIVALSCSLSWYSGRFCWAAPIALAVGGAFVPYFVFNGFVIQLSLAGIAYGVFAAAAEGFCLLARREMPRTGWWAYFGLAAVHLVACLFDGVLSTGMLAGIWAADVVCCLAITLLVFRAGRRVTFYPAAWMVMLFVLQFGMTYWTLPFDLGRAALHFAVVLVPQLLLTLVLLLRRPSAVQASE